MNLNAVRRIEALELRVKPMQPIAEADLPAAIEERLAPHLSRGVTLLELAKGSGYDAELARLLLSAAARKMLEDAEQLERERALG